MKPIFVILVGLLIFQPRVFAGFGTAISKTNQVILPSGQWAPSAEQTRNALAAIQAFLEKPTVTNDWNVQQIKKILEHANEYRVQFIGIEHDGKKPIRCNFFPADDTLGTNWKKDEIRVDDGGFWFWQVEFNPADGKCSNFSSNGYG